MPLAPLRRPIFPVLWAALVRSLRLRSRPEAEARARPRPAETLATRTMRSRRPLVRPALEAPEARIGTAVALTARALRPIVEAACAALATRATVLPGAARAMLAMLPALGTLFLPAALVALGTRAVALTVLAAAAAEGPVPALTALAAEATGLLAAAAAEGPAPALTALAAEAGVLAAPVTRASLGAWAALESPLVVIVCQVDVHS